MRTKEPGREQAIIDAAIAVFAEKGFHKAQIAKIAETANIAAGTIYLYFESKDDILLKTFDTVWKKLHDNLKLVINNKVLSSIEKFDLMIDILFDEFTGNKQLAKVIIHEQNNMQLTHPDRFTPYYDKFLDLGEDIMKEGIFTNSFNPGMDAKLFRVFMIGGLRNLIDHWAQQSTKVSLNAIRMSIKEVTKGGILHSSKKKTSKKK